ncbi:MAG: hypothetical protein FVQ82_06635 [Planctomycetes bacterium]|nr:hypothetical protein [Planctomycetota bacterium]
MQTPTITISVLLIIMVLFLPRKWILLPFVMAACIVPADQRVIIMGLDFTPLRMVVLFGLLKLLITVDKKPIRWNLFDKLILTWVMSGTIIYIIQWHTMRSVIYKSGVIFDCLGLYYIFRRSLTSWDDVFFTIKLFAFFAIVSAPLMIYERMNQESLFSSFGRSTAMFHRGRYRCSGPFPHPIMMGLFWANLLPLFYGCIKAKMNKIFFFSAIAAAGTCVFLSGSSTPVMTAGAIVGFWFIYRFRMDGKVIFIGLVCLITGLHLVMKAPVWHLISRVNIFSGSTGYHRYELINQTISHFSEWALIGCKNVEKWGVWAGDITNQFIIEGITGGLVTMLIFIFIVGCAIRLTGRASIISQHGQTRWICWAMSVSIMGHCVSFFGVSYFGQITMLLYLQFACVSFISQRRSIATVPTTICIRRSPRPLPRTNGCLNTD